MNGHVHEFGHEFMSESMSEADSDTDMRLFGTSDTDMDKVMTSDTDMGSDKGMSENLGHGLGHGQTSDTRVRSSLIRISIGIQNLKNYLLTYLLDDSFCLKQYFCHYTIVSQLFDDFSLVAYVVIIKSCGPFSNYLVPNMKLTYYLSCYLLH